MQESIEAKRAATSHVEVISAEDIGKMPDKNVADSLTRVPGVTTSSASANEGGFDENDRVSMRGTNPSLTQTLINGHNVGSGDWFVLNQTGTVGRSVSYTLLPSELIDQVVVHKSSQASLVEGGVAGSIDIITRKPLDFQNPFTFQASAGVVYAELPDKTDGQYSALGNWKNEAETFGVMVQGFWETRHLRRDGVEVLGYNTIAAGSPVALSNPDLAGVQFPDITGAALFQQKRERKGGLIDVQLKPSDDFMLDAQFFASKLEADNVNRNFLFFTRNLIGAGLAPLPGYVVRSNTLVSAEFGPGPASAVYDQISRPGESGSSNFGSLEGTLAGQRCADSRGAARHLGRTRQDAPSGRGRDGERRRPGLRLPVERHGQRPRLLVRRRQLDACHGAVFGWLFGVQDVDVKDKEDWAKIDARIRHGQRRVDELQVRRARQRAQPRIQHRHRAGPAGVRQQRLSDGLRQLSVGLQLHRRRFPEDIWLWSADQLEAYNDAAANRDPVGRRSFAETYQVEEKNSAGYVQADFKGSNWSGNIGVRYVQNQGECPQLRSGRRHGPGCHPRLGIRRRSSRCEPNTRTTTCCRART